MLKDFKFTHYCITLKAMPPKNIRAEYDLGVKEELIFIT